jgi:hypothetical protein
MPETWETVQKQDERLWVLGPHGTVLGQLGKRKRANKRMSGPPPRHGRQTEAGRLYMCW